MEPGVDDEGADPGSWGHVSCCGHWQPLVLAAPTVHHLSKHSAVCGSLHCFGASGCGRPILFLVCAGFPLPATVACLSACAWAFWAWSVRLMINTYIVGIHQQNRCWGTSQPRDPRQLRFSVPAASPHPISASWGSLSVTGSYHPTNSIVRMARIIIQIVRAERDSLLIPVHGPRFIQA